MRRAACALAVSTICLASASAHGGPSRRISEQVDPYSQQKTLTLELDTNRCAVETTPDEHSAHVRLMVYAEKSPAGPVEYALVVDITNNHLIHLGRHTSLRTLTDGQLDELYLVSERSKWSEHNAFTGSRRVRETVPFGVDRDFLTALAAAKTFQFRVDANRGTLERCTDSTKMRDLNDFLGRSATL